MPAKINTPTTAKKGSKEGTRIKTVIRPITDINFSEMLVREYNFNTKQGWGFLFSDIDDDEFYDAVMRALKVYKKDKAEWEIIVKNTLKILDGYS